jgi:O-methyltransferase/methyltransferase family protein/WG repeat protein
MTKEPWQFLEVAPDATHHVRTHLGTQESAYPFRFLKVLPYHFPGLAPAYDETGAFHIDVEGQAAYPQRYLKSFGFYQKRAAAESSQGAFHILPDGQALYSARYAWCGNYQQNFCVVRDREGAYFHIDLEGKKAYSASFRYAGDFREGYATVQNEKGLLTHINCKGELLHSQWFLDLDVFHKGYARAKDRQGWFHINAQGQPLYPHRFAMIEPFYNGFARVEKMSGSLLIINEQGTDIHQLKEESNDPFHLASGELVSYWRLNTLNCACDLDLFDNLPASAEDLSKRLSLPLSSTKRLLRALQEMKLVQLNQEDGWQATHLGAFFNTHHPSSLHEASQLWREEHFSSWKDLKSSLQTESCSFEKHYGANWFQWLKKDPQKNRLYHLVLAKYAQRDYQKLPEILHLNVHQRILDVGGSQGTLLYHLLESYPHLSGTLLDLPDVICSLNIPLHLKERVHTISADFFNPWPAFFVDGAFLARILHDWPPLEALEILKKVHTVLKDSLESRLYIIENVLQEGEGQGGLLDLNMLVMTGGMERRTDQFQQLLSRAGFAIEKILPLNQVSSVIVAKKIQLKPSILESSL